jgi:hypothetical protein
MNASGIINPTPVGIDYPKGITDNRLIVSSYLSLPSPLGGILFVFKKIRCHEYLKKH